MAANVKGIRMAEHSRTKIPKGWLVKQLIIFRMGTGFGLAIPWCQDYLGTRSFPEREKTRLLLERKEEMVSAALSQLDDLFREASDMRRRVRGITSDLTNLQFSKSAEITEHIEPRLLQYQSYAEERVRDFSDSWFRLKFRYGVPLDDEFRTSLQGVLAVLAIWSKLLEQGSSPVRIMDIPPFISVTRGELYLPPYNETASMMLESDIDTKIAKLVVHLQETARRLSIGEIDLSENYEP